MSGKTSALAVGLALGILGSGLLRAAESASPAVIDASKYPNLQAALDAVPEAGGLVQLPPGEFKITKPLVLTRGNTRVEGAGAATRITNCNQQGEPALVIRPAELESNRKARLWRVQLANFRVCGDPAAVNNKSTEPKSGDGIQFRNVDELYVEGMSVDHNGGNGISLILCLEDPRIADSIITYNRQAGLNIVGGHDIVVSANHFEENQDAVRCLDSYNLCMNGNNIDDHLGNGVVIENTYGSVLSGNMIEECNGTGIVLDRDCYGITLSANVLAHNVGGGIDLRDAWGCAVSANTFTLDDKFGLRIGPDAGRIAVTGNSFCNSNIGGKVKRTPEAPSCGLRLVGTSDNVISGNIFTGMQDQAITATGACQRLAITGNLMADLNRGGTKRPAMDMEQTPNSTIENNTIGPNETPQK